MKQDVPDIYADRFLKIRPESRKYIIKMGNNNSWVPFYSAVNVPETNYYNFCRIDLLYGYEIRQYYAERYEGTKLGDYINVVRYLIDHKVKIPDTSDFPDMLDILCDTGRYLEGENQLI